MLLISHEAPTAFIPLVMRYTTLDFAIAHYVLDDPMYARIYANRAPWRPLILDNAKFELIEPLPPDKVVKAAYYLKANYIIPPDHFEDLEATKESFREFKGRKDTPPGAKLAPVCVGKTPEELFECYKHYAEDREVQMICLSFLGPRTEALQLVVQEKLLAKKLPHHLLGYKGRTELERCFKLLKGVKDISLDTSKPVAAAHEGIELVCHAGDVQRGKYPRPPLDQVYIDTELLRINIETFRFWVQEAYDAAKETETCA